MILLPGCLPADRATLAALCKDMDVLPDLATHLRSAVVESFEGTWSDAERSVTGSAGDLPAGRDLARTAPGEIAHLAGQAVVFAVATPMHAALGLTDLAPIDSSTLQLSDEDSRTLCEDADAHLREEGVRLHFVSATQWLLSVDRNMEVLTERPDWMTGEALRPNLPRGKDARTVERWMNELQMLLFTHPVNIAREDRGLPPVNVIWLWGFSPPAGSGVDASALDAANTRWLSAFRNGDIAAWQDAWRDVAARVLAADAIILGDHRPRLRLGPSSPTFFSRFMSRFQPAPKLADVLMNLHPQ